MFGETDNKTNNLTLHNSNLVKNNFSTQKQTMKQSCSESLKISLKLKSQKEIAYQGIPGTKIDTISAHNEVATDLVGNRSHESEALGSPSKGRTGKKNSNNGSPFQIDKAKLRCDHCGMSKHTKAQCFKLVGYPEWWNDDHKKSNKDGRKLAAAVGNVDQHRVGERCGGLIGITSARYESSDLGHGVKETDEDGGGKLNNNHQQISGNVSIYLICFFAVAASGFLSILRNGSNKHDILGFLFVSGGMDHNHFNIKTFMAIMAERDAAIQERNLALEERKRAFAERDLAMLQRDAALAERNSAIQERDEAISTLRFRGNFINENIISTASDIPENIQNHGSKRGYSDEETHHMFEIPDDYQLPPETTKPRKVTKKTKSQSPRARNKRADAVNIKPDYEESSGDAQLEAWKDELGLNQVNFDETAMPVPVCSCTGVPQPCYRWGNGGWQSACCTTTMSMYPLPLVSNKRYSRVGGRKMSGGAFTKLLSRLASEGYDLSSPLDLKEHWAKHGTNRYSTVK